MQAGAGANLGTEAANASSLQALEQDVLGVVNAPTEAWLGRPLIGNGMNGAAGTGQGGGAGGLLIGTGGTGGTGLGLLAGIAGVGGHGGDAPTGIGGNELEARSQAFVECHRGARTWRDVIRTGDITVSGRPPLGRAFPTWNLHAPVVDPKFSRMAGCLKRRAWLT